MADAIDPVRRNTPGKTLIEYRTLQTFRPAACYNKREGKREPFGLFIIVVVDDTDGHIQH